MFFPLFEEFFLIRKEFRHLIDFPGYMLTRPEEKGLLVSWERLAEMSWEGDWKGDEEYTLLEEIGEHLRQRFAEDWTYIRTVFSKQQEVLSE